MTRERIKGWLLDIFACHTLIVDPKLENEAARRTAKISAMITVSLPLLVLLGAYVAICSKPTTLDTTKTVIVISVLVIYFGVSSITDRMFDSNLPEIERRAEMIGGDPERGTSWVRRRLAGIYCANFAVLAVVITSIRLLR